MARPRSDDSEGISLFPFLSILACVIGVLTLLISALALAQMDTEAIATAEQYERLEKEIDATRQQLDELLQQQSQADRQASQQQQELAEARRQLEDLQGRVEQARQQNEQRTKKVDVPDVDQTAHNETIEELQEELERLQERIAQLEKEIAERNLPPEESEVTVVPGGSGVGFTPHFVECADGSIVIHAGPEPVRIRTGAISGDERFLELLDKVAGSSNDSIVFLVRSDGLGTYHAARRLAGEHEARNGKLPVIGQGRIDLSHFRKAAGR